LYFKTGCTINYNQDLVEKQEKPWSQQMGNALVDVSNMEPQQPMMGDSHHH
jgi:hypothetical protein